MADTRQIVNWSLEQGCKLLRDTLGEERFLRFARAYLVALGESPEAADAIVIETEEAEKRRGAKRRQEEELRAMKDKYLCDRIFAGLKTVLAPRSELEGDEDEEPPSTSAPWFDADNLAQAIRRAAGAGISVTYMTHHSASGELDRHQSSELTEPLALLEKWTKEGCSEKFSAGFRVPDTLVRSQTWL